MNPTDYFMHQLVVVDKETDEWRKHRLVQTHEAATADVILYSDDDPF